MKICFCIGRMSFSGAENVVRFLAESLLKRGHEVSVLLLERLPDESEYIEGLTVESAIVPGTGVKNILRRVCMERQALKRLRPDVFVIFNCEMAFSAVPASFGLRHTKVVVCERNDPEMVPPSPKRRKLRDILYRLAHAGVYQTERISGYFEKATPVRFVVENPIRGRYDPCLPLAQREPVFVTVARLDDRQKNQSMLIRAFVRAAQVHPEYQLHLLGDGPDEEKYRALIRELGAEDKVKLLGKHSAPQEYIRRCRGFVLTSEYEGMPNALIEAMAVGLPCISTDCGGGGAAALIQNNENGILIDRGDEEALTKQILRLMEDETLCEKLGDAAHQINQRLDPQKVTENWETMCKTLLKGSRE